MAQATFKQVFVNRSGSLQENTVAHSLSAKKRVKQNEKRRIINRSRKSRIKTQAKRFEATLEKGDVETAGEQLRLLTKKLDKTAATSTMHKKTAARKKSRLAKKLNALKAMRGQGTSSPSTSPEQA
jgi:small subunit ribosomal protein S20